MNRIPMAIIWFWLLIATAVLSVSLSCVAEPTNRAERLTVHGRMSYYNGNPSRRIWIIGTKRMLGVRETDTAIAEIPKNLAALSTWDREIFADFVVEPLTPMKQGVMQIVRVIAARNIVISENGKVIGRRATL